MNPLLLARRVLGLAFLAVLFGACDALYGASELERAIAAEQRAITAYAEAAAVIDARAATFAEAWARANEHRDPVMYRDDLRAHALPAGRALLDALEAAPVESAELEALHRPLVAAHAALFAALEALAEALPRVDVAEAYAPVIEALDALRDAEATYRRGIETYYARNRATLKPPPASAP